MKNRLLALIFCLFLVCTFFKSYAETYQENLDINSFLNTCKIVDDKVYIEPGMIYVAPQQILLNVSGFLLSIKNLSADENAMIAKSSWISQNML